MNSSILIYLITPLIAAASQLMLKKAADDPRFTGLRFYVNPKRWQIFAIFYIIRYLYLE